MKSLAIAALLAAGASFAQTQPAANSNAVTWQLATGYRAEGFHGRNLEQFVRDVKVATNDQLVIELKPNNSLFKLAEIQGAVQEGKIQAGESIMSGMAKSFPASGADSVPFVVGSYSDATRLWKTQRPVIERAFEKNGLKVLYAVPWPPQGFYSKKPITTLKDFANTKMRTYNPATQRIAELLGAKGVDVPMVDVGNALREGRIDNMITSAVTGAENKVWGEIKHYYEINAWFPKNIVYVNAKAFSALPANSQKAVLNAAAAAQERGWEMSMKAAQDATDELRRNGMKIDRMPREIDVALKRMGEKFSREWVSSVGQDASAIFTPYYFGVPAPSASSAASQNASK
jgi:TRAP-type transport system periplasmic protein